jgi:ABC-type branched-subunit amino acid transport system ATPase component
MTAQQPTDPEAALSFENITKAFGGLLALGNVSGTIPEGRVTALIGSNGAGKTTLLNVITGFLPMDSGTVRYRGADITGEAPHDIAKLGVARTFQDLRLFSNMTVFDNVMAAFPGQSGERVRNLFAQWLAVDRQERELRRRSMELLEFVGLAHKRRVPANDLSYGQQKRLALARVLATGSEVLMLDEPTAGLDPEAVEEMGTLIRRLIDDGKTICLVEHDLDMVMRHADWVIGMGQGTILVEANPETAFANEDLIASYITGGGP